MKMSWFLVFRIYVSDQQFEDSMDLLVSIDDDQSHYVYIKDFDWFMFDKIKEKHKKMVFVEVVYNVSVVKMCW